MTESYPLVVVGVGEAQPAVLQFAAREARHLHGDLRVVHAYGTVDPLAGPYPDGAAGGSEMRLFGHALLVDAKRILDEESFRPLAVEYVLSRRGAAATLVEESRDARILVLGTDRVWGSDRLLGGNITAHLTRAAGCPVAVVPETTHPPSSDGRVVVALDGGEMQASGPLQFAFDQARVRSVGLDVLHAVPAHTAAGDAEAARADVKAVFFRWHALYPDVPATITYTVAEPDQAVLRASNRAGLVVIGRSHLHLRPFAVARPLASSVIRAAGCPVVVVPSDYSRSEPADDLSRQAIP